MAIRGDTKRVILAQVILTTPYTHRENTQHLQWCCFCLLRITHSQIYKFNKLHFSLSSVFQKQDENQLNQVSFEYYFIYDYLINGNEFQTLILEVKGYNYRHVKQNFQISITVQKILNNWINFCFVNATVCYVL